MDRFKQKYVRDTKTGRFVPFKDVKELPYQLKSRSSLMGLEWIDYVDVIESKEQEWVNEKTY